MLRSTKAASAAISVVLMLSCLLGSAVGRPEIWSGQLTSGSLLAAAGWTNFQAATRVLGQVNFVSSTGGSTNAKFLNPLSAVVDPTTGKVFVSDFSNNRILRFTGAAALTNGASAEAVLGQPDFATTTSATAQNKLSAPQQLVVDTSGRLWVADTGNNRVLRFDNAQAKASGANADGVLGQALFTTNTATTTQTGMSSPSGLFVESSGVLYVAEQLNNRVTRFNAAASKANGGAADGVLGQAGFTTSTGATTQNSLLTPNALAGDSSGRLWVCDANNERVLRFDNAGAKANGANADGVLGQTLFTTFTTSLGASGMNFPLGVATDAVGSLYVSDANNNRVLIFNNAATLPNGGSASNVLGQPDFTTGTANIGGISASTLNDPRFVFFHAPSQDLFVADAANNRVLRFGPAVTTAANVTIFGRVVDSRGNGVRGARVVITDSRGHTLTATTNAFGHYAFTGVPSGDTYIANAVSRGMTFSPRVVMVNDAVAGLDIAGR